ncbi:thioredoxin family protein [Marinomonas sp. C2222]|uniref:Thioredoxin family protein n=1 Tax=Marinomonas sargassi TaxID=2984494 RepID=A0ABT2YVH0_9GAMM|nr:thioredoxin family protein [Marinomonas sargassi]MCV2403876.1 thioredoxin family protein [Marinomonas sargassi]
MQENGFEVVTLGYSADFLEKTPKVEGLTRMSGWALLEFGTNWCGYCKAAQPLLCTVMESYPKLPHMKVFDGKGKKLGRQFKVTLWPTLILLKDGEEKGRLVRFVSPDQIQDLLSIVV